MIQIILLVQNCRNGSGTVQNKKINLFLLDSESVAKVHQQPLLTHWVIQNYGFLKALFYMKLCHMTIILTCCYNLFYFCCIISTYLLFSCLSLPALLATVCRHSLKKLSDDLGTVVPRDSGGSQLDHGKEFQHSGLACLRETTVMFGCRDCVLLSKGKETNILTSYHSSRIKCINMHIIEAFRIVFALKA